MVMDNFTEEILNITLLSIRVSGLAVLIGALIGIPIGTVLGFKQFKGKKMLMRFVDVMLKSVINTFMGLPPVIAGLVVYLLLTTSGPLGWLGLLYTPTAMIITQLIIVVPIIIGVTMSAVGSVSKAIREKALSLGATESQAAWIVLKEARVGVLTSIIVAFGAAISEVGGIMIAGGNIRWVTRTLTTAIVIETELGNFTMALTLGAILLAIAFMINLALTIIQLKGAKR
ncbi:MAG: ABC transporter permease [Nitrososphaerales archaeon]